MARGLFEIRGEVKLSEIAALFKEHELNQKWCKDNYKDLVEKYDGVFVAIYKKRVIEHGKNPDELRQKYWLEASNCQKPWLSIC